MQAYISQIFEHEKKYEKRVAHRDDLVQTNSLIFDMQKFGEVKVTRNDNNTSFKQYEEPWFTTANV